MSLAGGGVGGGTSIWRRLSRYPEFSLYCFLVNIAVEGVGVGFRENLDANFFFSLYTCSVPHQTSSYVFYPNPFLLWWVSNGEPHTSL